MTENIYTGDRRELLKYFSRDYQKVLDVGCSGGNFGALLKSRHGSSVTGIEFSPEAARAAEKKLDRVLCVDVEFPGSAFPEGPFDCIVFADVLEHLREPLQVLKTYAQYLKPKGVMIISVPNVRHISVVADLLFLDEWRYQDSGILDRTHLRFFTRKSFERLLSEAGLVVEKHDFILSLRGSRWIDRVTFGILRGILAAQYIFVVRKEL